MGMGFTPEEIKDSLLNQKYNEVTATYLLLGRKGEVSHGKRPTSQSCSHVSVSVKRKRTRNMICLF